MVLRHFCLPGQQCGGGPGPAGDRDLELSAQTAPSAGHPPASQG